ncbi:MAG: zf-HC2 domain-containing protein, partial [Vicinamibacteraceae bacterium]|nr:zf-HC2 domain-containing protein [Vicinamibacteraceae bacterium]
MSLPFRSNGACPDALTLGRFVDDDLAGPEARRLVAHVEACPACRNEV